MRSKKDEQNRIRVANWRRRNPDKVRDTDLRRLYGIGIEEYNEIFVSQGMVCAVCRSAQNSNDDNFCVDHDHETKSIRGILCRSCNVTLGIVKDDPEILSRMIGYLKSNLSR